MYRHHTSLTLVDRHFNVFIHGVIYCPTINFPVDYCIFVIVLLLLLVINLVLVIWHLAPYFDAITSYGYCCFVLSLFFHVEIAIMLYVIISLHHCF